MALPLSVFKTIPADVPLAPTVIYTAPTGYTGIVLTAQALNTNSSTEHIFSMSLVRNGDAHPLVYEYQIPSNEVLIASGGSAGKLVLQTGDALLISGSSTDLKFTLSVLETLV